MHRILFQIGSFTVYSYGFFVALAFAVSTVLMVRDAKKFDLPANKVFDCVVVVLAGGLMGGRLLFVAINWELYSHDLIRIFNFHEGGLAFQGALAGGLLGGFITSRIKKLPFWRTSDLIAPYIALGQAVGRIGCFLNGCCYGKVTSSGLGVTFPSEVVMRVPTQIYSSIILVVIFVLLIFSRDRRPFDGYVFSLYLIIYGIYRFFIDFLRGDNLASFGPVTLSQAIGLGITVCGIIVLSGLSFANRRG